MDLLPLCSSTVSDTSFICIKNHVLLNSGYLKDFEQNKQVIAAIEKSCVTKNYSIVFTNCENETTIYLGYAIMMFVM